MQGWALGAGRAEGLGFLGGETKVVILLTASLGLIYFLCPPDGGLGPGRSPGQETLGPQQRKGCGQRGP